MVASVSQRVASASRFGVISEIEEIAKGQKKRKNQTPECA